MIAPAAKPVREIEEPADATAATGFAVGVGVAPAGTPVGTGGGGAGVGVGGGPVVGGGGGGVSGASTFTSARGSESATRLELPHGLNPTLAYHPATLPDPFPKHTRVTQLSTGTFPIGGGFAWMLNEMVQVSPASNWSQ